MVLKRLRDIKVGDWVQGANNRRVQVTQVFEEHVPQASFLIEGANGETIKVSGNHLFYVVTETDKLYHRTRIKDSAKALKKLPPKTIEALELMASNPNGHETTIDEMRALLGGSDSVCQVVDRVALSIGRIAEENHEYHSVNSDKYTEETYYIYDGALFAQQILALYQPKKYPYTVKIGRVINTYALSMIFEDVELPDVH